MQVSDRLSMPDLSVSRVGGAAQIKAMKKIAAPIRVELAQYRELAAFSQFGSELDADTKEKLEQGEQYQRSILKQPQYQPMPVQYQVIILYAATKKYLLDIPVEDITCDLRSELFEFLDTTVSGGSEGNRNGEAGNFRRNRKSTAVTAIEEFKKRLH